MTSTLIAERSSAEAKRPRRAASLPMREDAIIRVTLDRPDGEDAPRTELNALTDLLFETWYPTARHLHPRIQLDDIREAEDSE